MHMVWFRMKNNLNEHYRFKIYLFFAVPLADFVLEISEDDKKVMLVHLRSMWKVTWTAKKLASVITGSSSRRYSDL